MKVARLSVLRTGRLYSPWNIPVFISVKFLWHHRELKQQPSSLYCSFSTNCATTCLVLIKAGTKLCDKHEYSCCSDRQFLSANSLTGELLAAAIGDAKLHICLDGCGGRVVSMLASGSRVRGFKPGRSRWIFTSAKTLSMPSFGGEVKVSVPCPSFAACNRT
jgi:hypothetical protein